MRRTILLLATMALALLLVGGVAASKQQQDESTSSQPATTLSPSSEQSGGEDAAASQSTTTPPAIGQQGARQQGGTATASDKGSGDVSIESSSTTPKASFASGSGENRLSVKVSDHGNLMSFESPALQEAVIQEGYVVCSNNGIPVHGHDTGSVEGGFGTPTFVQPTAGAFPLTVTRTTTDGKFQLKQLWAKPDAAEKDVTLTMTLTNRSSAAIGNVILTRTGDFDVGPNFNDLGAATNDSAWLWDDIGDRTEIPPGGLMMTALTLGIINDPAVEPLTSWNNQTNPSRTQCFGSSPTTPVGEGDWDLRMISSLGNLSAGQSKTVKLSYSRM